MVVSLLDRTEKYFGNLACSRLFCFYIMKQGILTNVSASHSVMSKTVFIIILCCFVAALVFTRGWCHLAVRGGLVLFLIYWSKK